METTLHIHLEMLQQIAAVAESRGISRSELIVLLIAQIARDIDNPGRLGRRDNTRVDRNQMIGEFFMFSCVRIHMSIGLIFENS